MSFKRLLLIAVTAQLAAACNNGLTAPVVAVLGGAASHAKAAPADTTKSATPPATANSEFNDCGWTVQLGYVGSDTTCPDPER